MGSTLRLLLINVAWRCADAQIPNSSPRWIEFISHWPLWSIYIAHFSMNWSNYIIMQWLPTYMARNLGADKQDIMFTAVPYLLNSLVGVGEQRAVPSRILLGVNSGLGLPSLKTNRMMWPLSDQ